MEIFQFIEELRDSIDEEHGRKAAQECQMALWEKCGKFWNNVEENGKILHIFVASVKEY